MSANSAQKTTSQPLQRSLPKREVQRLRREFQAARWMPRAIALAAAVHEPHEGLQQRRLRAEGPRSLSPAQRAGRWGSCAATNGAPLAEVASQEESPVQFFHAPESR